MLQLVLLRLAEPTEIAARFLEISDPPRFRWC
jgi:hypothetical protein